MIDTILQQRIESWITVCNGDTALIERNLLSDGISTVAGVDEAGRGPLAGPVVAAAVVLPHDCPVYGITDSKLIPHSKRTELAHAIKENAIDIGIGIIGPDEIDRINILQATNSAIQKAVDSLAHRPELLLIDGKYLDYPRMRAVSIIKGDLHCRTIAAASIIAKVTRDSIMKELHTQYPEYGFDRHKGYPTKEHKAAIRQYGMSPVHRRSYNIT